MRPVKNVAMTVLGAVCLIVLSPLILLFAAVFGIAALILLLIRYPRYRKSGFPGAFSLGLAGTAVFRAFCVLSPEKRRGTVYTEGDLPLLHLADGTVIAAPEADLFYRLTEENAETVGVPGEWVVDVIGESPVNLSAFFREAEEKGLRPVVVTPEQPDVLPEDADAFRADTRFITLSALDSLL